MKKVFRIMFVTALAVFSLTFVSCNKDHHTPSENGKSEKAKYTIMFYGCGGGDVDTMLEDGLKDYLKALGTGGKTVRFAVMYNMSMNDKRYTKNGQHPSYLGDWGQCYRYELTADTDLSKEGYRSKYRYNSAGNVPLFKESTLVDYIKWVKENVPAENYILVPANHGGGFDLDHETLTRAIVYDDNFAGKGLATKTIAEALKETDTHLKAIFWFGCLMGQLEVLTELAPYCDYQFASAHVSRAITQLLSTFIEALNESPDDFEKAAGLHYDKVGAEYVSNFYNVAGEEDPQKGHFENCDFSCWRSGKIAAVNAEVKKMAEYLVENYKTKAGRQNIDDTSQFVYLFQRFSPYADVLDYAYKLAIAMNDTRATSIYGALAKAITEACVYSVFGLHRKDAKGNLIIPYTQCYTFGVSLYSPKKDNDYVKYGASYRESAFDKATGWSKWLDVNEVSVLGEDTLNPCNDSTWEIYWL